MNSAFIGELGTLAEGAMPVLGFEGQVGDRQSRGGGKSCL